MAVVITVPAGLVPMKVFSLNARPHWAQRHRVTAVLRRWVELEARQAGLGAHDRVQVRVTFHPPDRRRRDRDNLVRVQKTMVDGLVDAGVVPDDTPEHVDVGLPVIGDVAKPARWVLEVTPLPTTMTKGAA